MKIAILGAGAMGCIYGARLSAIPDNQVVLIDVWKEHLEAINRDGILLEEAGALTAYPHVRGTAAVVLLLVTAYAGRAHGGRDRGRAALAAAGRGRVRTGALPSVALVNTGGEIVPPGLPLGRNRERVAMS